MSEVYVRSTTTGTWDNVKSQCEDAGGQLATFDNGDDITDIHEVCVAANEVISVAGCWLGLLF